MNKNGPPDKTGRHSTTARFKDHFSGHAASYAQARPGYPAALFSWLAEQCVETQLAWDCATGNGQAAVGLARHFDRVIATDASATQIGNAMAHPGVEYRVATAESPGIDDSSCDLVTVAQALHWFDVEAFYREAERVLKPGGVLAAWGYHLTRVSPDVDGVIDRFDREIVGACWPPERRHIDSRYGTLNFPFVQLDVPVFTMTIEWNRRQFLDYIGTWSAARRCREMTGRNPLSWLEEEIAPHWKPEETRQVSWPMFFLAGRKPA